LTYNFDLPDITDDVEAITENLDKPYRCRIRLNASCETTEEFNDLIQGIEERLGRRPDDGLWVWNKIGDRMFYYFSGGAGYVYAKQIKELIGCLSPSL